MAKILNDRQQLEALDTVNKNLEKLKLIDTFIVSSGYVLSHPEIKKGRTLPINEEYAGKIRPFLSKMREQTVREVQRLIAKYRLQLSEEEKQLLSHGSDLHNNAETEISE